MGQLRVGRGIVTQTYFTDDDRNVVDPVKFFRPENVMANSAEKDHGVRAATFDFVIEAKDLPLLGQPIPV